MASPVQFTITSPRLSINNQTIFVKPNSVKFTEGFGEQQVRTQSGGGGSIGLLVVDNAEDKMSTVNITLDPTELNLKLARGWKTNPGKNALTITSGTDSDFTRTVLGATLTNNYEAGLSADGTIELIFIGAQSS